MLNILIIVLGIGIIQSLIFALLAAQKQAKRVSDFLLLAWFLAFTIHFSLILMVDLDQSLFTLAIAKNFVLLYGPLLWLYTYSLYSENFSARQWGHLLLFVLLTAAILIIQPDQDSNWEVALVVLKILSLIVYPLYSLRWIDQRIQDFKKIRADNFAFEARWIRSLAYLILVNAAIGILHVLGDVTFMFQFSEIVDILTYVIMITIMGFNGIKFGVMVQAESGESKPSEKSYKHSPITEQERSVHIDRIEQFFEQSDMYLESDFSLSALSEALGIPKHHLSEIINSAMGRTFYDLVNGKRIEYAIQRLREQSDGHITLEGLGYEAGFSTKSAFYHHFKAQTGKTPGQFKAEIRPD